MTIHKDAEGFDDVDEFWAEDNDADTSNLLEDKDETEEEDCTCCYSALLGQIDAYCVDVYSQYGVYQ
jgi:hypothetical protein